MIRMLLRHGWQDWRTPGEAMAPERTGAMMQQMCVVVKFFRTLR